MPVVYIEKTTDNRVSLVRDMRTSFGIGLGEAINFADSLLSSEEPLFFEYGTYNSDYKPLNIKLHFNGRPVINTYKKSHKFYRPDDNKKIQCIKEIRSVFDIGLREAKDMVDEMWGTFDVPQSNWIHRDLTELEIYHLTRMGYSVVSNSPAFSFTEQEEDLFRI